MIIREKDIPYYQNELYHFGVKGMKWGIRRNRKKQGSKRPSITKILNDELEIENNIINKMEKKPTKEAKRYYDVTKRANYLAKRYNFDVNNPKSGYTESDRKANAEYQKLRKEYNKLEKEFNKDIEMKVGKQICEKYGKMNVLRAHTAEKAAIGATIVGSILLSPIAFTTFGAYMAYSSAKYAINGHKNAKNKSKIKNSISQKDKKWENGDASRNAVRMGSHAIFKADSKFGDRTNKNDKEYITYLTNELNNLSKTYVGNSPSGNRKIVYTEDAVRKSLDENGNLDYAFKFIDKKRRK